MSPKSVGLLCAVPLESNLILKRFRLKRIKSASFERFEANSEGLKLALVHSGIGLANAAHSSAMLIERFSPDVLINFGIAGACPDGGLSIGDIAVASSESYADSGVSDGGGFDLIGIPILTIKGKKVFNIIPLGSGLLKKAKKALPHAVTGGFITVASASASARRARGLCDKYGAICENMEGAAIAHVCAIHKIPFLQIRGISNIAGVRDKKKWDIKTASENAQEAVTALLKAFL